MIFSETNWKHSGIQTFLHSAGCSIIYPNTDSVNIHPFSIAYPGQVTEASCPPETLSGQMTYLLYEIFDHSSMFWVCPVVSSKLDVPGISPSRHPRQQEGAAFLLWSPGPCVAQAEVVSTFKAVSQLSLLCMSDNVNRWADSLSRQ